MSLIYKTPWTCQPQIQVGIDWGNPITKGLAFAVNHIDGSNNVVTNNVATLSANSVRAVNDRGRSLYTTAQPYAASWPGVISTSDGIGTGDFTLLSFSKPVSEANISALLSQSTGSGSVPQAYLLANTNSGFGASAGAISFGVTNALIQASSVVDGNSHVFVGIRQGANGIIDVDGINQTTTALSGADIYTAGTSIILASGINGYTTWTRAHPHFLQLAWNRALTQAERYSIGKNPWQVFQPVTNRFLFPSVAAGGTAALTGTATTANEGDIVTGGKTIILTLTGDTWVASGATFDAQRQNIIDGLDSAQSEAAGWDAEVKAKQGVAGVVRTSDTVVTITLDAQAAYDITATETITCTIPSTAVSLGAQIVASPTFQITATVAGVLSLIRGGLVNSGRLTHGRLVG